MNKKILFLVLVIGLLVFTSIRKVIAENDDDDEREDRYEEEHEDEREDEDDNWDLSDDFDQEDSLKELPTERVIIKKIVQPEIPQNLTRPVNMTFESKINVSVPEINETLYKDDDNDGIMNKEDTYPGENDLLYIDSDNDGIVDAKDRYRGKNDLEFQDIDKDGVIDSHDSDMTKKTDMDHDGIDDKYDNKDDRSFIVKIMELFGIVNQ